MSRQHFPLARREGFVIQSLDGELVLYDGDVTHLLNATAASVWQLCDGHHSIADLSRELALDGQTISYALQQLERQHLLQNAFLLKLPLITRREFLKRAAIAAAAVPVVKTIRVPAPSLAASNCVASGDCVPFLASGCCSGQARACVAGDSCVDSPDGCCV